MERWLAGGWKGVWSLGEGELGGGSHQWVVSKAMSA